MLNKEYLYIICSTFEWYSFLLKNKVNLWTSFSLDRHSNRGKFQSFYFFFNIKSIRIFSRLSHQSKFNVNALRMKAYLLIEIHRWCLSKHLSSFVNCNQRTIRFIRLISSFSIVIRQSMFILYTETISPSSYYNNLCIHFLISSFLLALVRREYVYRLILFFLFDVFLSWLCRCVLSLPVHLFVSLQFASSRRRRFSSE